MALREGGPLPRTAGAPDQGATRIGPIRRSGWGEITSLTLCCPRRLFLKEHQDASIYLLMISCLTLAKRFTVQLHVRCEMEH
jgi:hypothetical protein